MVNKKISRRNALDATRFIGWSVTQPPSADFSRPGSRRMNSALGHRVTLHELKLVASRFRRSTPGLFKHLVNDHHRGPGLAESMLNAPSVSALGPGVTTPR